MDECKHGLKQGCFYCHGQSETIAKRPPVTKKPGRRSALSEQMNDRMTALKQRLRQIRGE